MREGTWVSWRALQVLKCYSIVAAVVKITDAVQYVVELSVVLKCNMWVFYYAIQAAAYKIHGHMHLPHLAVKLVKD